MISAPELQKVCCLSLSEKARRVVQIMLHVRKGEGAGAEQGRAGQSRALVVMCTLT